MAKEQEIRDMKRIAANRGITLAAAGRLLMRAIIGSDKICDPKEYEALRKDGSSFWVSASWKPICFEGNYAGIRFSNQDIDDHCN